MKPRNIIRHLGKGLQSSNWTRSNIRQVGPGISSGTYLAQSIIRKLGPVISSGTRPRISSGNWAHEYHQATGPVISSGKGVQENHQSNGPRNISRNLVKGMQTDNWDQE
jgi:hypothetical protein